MSTVASLAVQWTGRLPGPTYEPTGDGSPGFAGFVATFVLAAAVVLLAVSFVRRMRRASHRERLRDRQGVPTVGEGAEQAAGAGAVRGTAADAPADVAGPADADRASGDAR